MIHAEWDRPANDGGSEITGYEVQFRGSGSWEKVPVDGVQTYTSIYEHSNGTPLTNGRRYNLRVRAVNEHGFRGPYAQGSVVPVKPRIVPSEPRNVEFTGGARAHRGDLAGALRPGPSGAERLPGAVPRVRQRGVAPRHADLRPSDARSATITGLTNGVTYQVQVWAVNSAGDSPKAGADGAFEATPEKASDGDERPPTNPRNLRLSPGSGRITASWSAPSDRGDPAFAGYEVQYRCRWCGHDEWTDWTTVTFGEEESTTATRVTITGWIRKRDYQVRVTTVDNGYGSGLAIAQTTTR